jgi:hypothetical protein
MLLGAFALGTRIFRRPALAAPMVVAIVLVRTYGTMVEVTALPQIAPIRLDLWLPLVAVVAVVGLQHTLTGLTMGLLIFFSRSMGTLFLAAYTMALAADFLARRRACPRAERLALGNDVRRALVRIAPSVALIALSLVAARIVFGTFGSSALAIYRQYGVGMLRIGRDSSYWWILPLSGALGWLTFDRRGLDERRAQTALFAVTLMAVGSIYFFGRSHEHNLINIGASLLFCTFLALDLAGSHPAEGTALTRGALRAAPWLIVAACAYSYSGRVAEKMEAQVAIAKGRRPVPASVPTDFRPIIDCEEIANAAGDPRVYFFSANDYWYYQRCGYIPQGYLQPVSLAVLKKPLVADLNALLDAGYKVVVPHQSKDYAPAFHEFLSDLANPSVVETTHYSVYRKRVGPRAP